MSKSIKFKNNNYLDSSSIVHNKKVLKDTLITGTNLIDWQKSYSIPYSEDVKPMLIWVWWGQSMVFYSFYREKLFVITSDKKDYDNIDYSIDTTNKNINFILSNTGIIYYITTP